MRQRHGTPAHLTVLRHRQIASAPLHWFLAYPMSLDLSFTPLSFSTSGGVQLHIPSRARLPLRAKQRRQPQSRDDLLSEPTHSDFPHSVTCHSAVRPGSGLPAPTSPLALQ